MKNLLAKLNTLLGDNTLLPNEKTFLQNVITQIENIGKYISELFKKTVSLFVAEHDMFEITAKRENELWKAIEKREDEKGNPTPWHDDDIAGWFTGKCIVGIVNGITSNIYRFTQKITNRQILEEGEKMGVKQIYTWLEARLLIQQAILNGEVDVKGTGVIVYFKIDGNDTLYRFVTWRYVGGQLGVYVSLVRLDGECDAGDGVCFR